MRARLRPFLLLAPLAWTGRVRADEAAAAPEAGLLAAVMRRLAAVPQSRARFTETKTVAALRAPLQSSGRLAYRRPDRLEKTTDRPRPEVLAVQGSQLTLTSGGTTRTVDLASQPAVGALVEAILGTLAGDLAGLQRWYYVSATGTLADWRLDLRPSGAALARFVREVTIRGTAARLTRLRTVAANGDVTVMTILPADRPARGPADPSAGGPADPAGRPAE